MKQAVILLTFIFFAINAKADCASEGLYVWPSGQTLTQNPIILLDGYAHSQNVIEGLNKKFPIYLKSGSKKINLTVKEILKGEFYLTQAVMTVDEKLEAGKEYELFIDSLAEYESPLRKWNVKTKKYEGVTWTVVGDIDSTVPLWKTKPTEIKKTLIHYGCGPAINVHFNFKIEEKSEFLIKANVTNKKTQKTTSYYLEPNDSTIEIGHEMCSGAFIFENGEDYEVSFDILDASGNLTTWTGEKIAFTRPTEENSSEK